MNIKQLLKHIKLPVLALALVAGATATACDTMKRIASPEALECAPPIGDLIEAVRAVVFGEMDVVQGLKSLQSRHGEETIVCTVRHVYRQSTSPGAKSDDDVRAAQRMRAAAVRMGFDL